MIISNASAHLRHQLVMELMSHGDLHSPTIAEAFGAVPRELFVPLFYRREERTWHPCSRDLSEERWLRQIYQDEALVTLLDAQNIPMSSSSQPSIMAAMLEALDIRPGMRVLEIGTGTGYNTALLAHLAGNPTLVTTVDLDPRLIEQATHTLHTLVGPVNVLVGNGFDIRLPERVDRIIVTASSPSIPRTWYDQLASHGRIVLPLMGSLGASRLLILMKEEAGGSGFFSPVPVAFMSMRQPGEEQPKTSVRDLLALPLAVSFRVEEAEEEAMIASLSDDDFRWFVQWLWPTGTLSILPMTLPDGRHAWQITDVHERAILQLTRRFDGSWKGMQRGAFPIYQRLMKLHKRFEQLGRPEKQHYQVQIDERQCSLFLQSCREQIILRDLFSSLTRDR